MKETLYSKCISDEETFTTDSVVPAHDFQNVLKQIHTKIVGEVVDAFQPNRVLGVRPPLIDPEETYLPRATCVNLSRLRSGFCERLQ